MQETVPSEGHGRLLSPSYQRKTCAALNPPEYRAWSQINPFPYIIKDTANQGTVLKMRQEAVLCITPKDTCMEQNQQMPKV